MTVSSDRETEIEVGVGGEGPLQSLLMAGILHRYRTSLFCIKVTKGGWGVLLVRHLSWQGNSAKSTSV